MRGYFEFFLLNTFLICRSQVQILPAPLTRGGSSAGRAADRYRIEAFLSTLRIKYVA